MGFSASKTSQRLYGLAVSEMPVSQFVFAVKMTFVLGSNELISGSNYTYFNGLECFFVNVLLSFNQLTGN